MGDVFEFVVVMATIFTAVWGTIFLVARIKRQQLEASNQPDDRLLEGVREELEAVSDRLMRLEEEMDFFRELGRGSEAPGLPSAGTTGASGPPSPGAQDTDAASLDDDAAG